MVLRIKLVALFFLVSSAAAAVVDIPMRQEDKIRMYEGLTPDEIDLIVRR